jgi:hypothetical protein
MFRSRLARTAPAAGLFSLLAVLVLAGTAFADGERRIELDAGDALPQAGVPQVFVIRVTEGDHTVDGAQVNLIAGQGGTHDSHDMGSAASSAAVPFESAALPAETPGEYLVEVEFPAEGAWTVWVTAEKKGVLTEAAYEVPVQSAPLPATAAASPADSHAAMSPAEMEAHGGESPIAEQAPVGIEPPLGAEEPAAPALTQISGDPHGAAAEDGHGHGAAGDVNWLVLGLFGLVIGGSTAAAAFLKRHLARQIALGNLQPQGAEVE